MPVQRARRPRQAQPGLVKISDRGRVFLVPPRTAFVPGACSVPCSAWDRNDRATLPLHERPLTGRACHSARTLAEPGHEGSRAGAATVWAQGTEPGSLAMLSLSEFSSPQVEPGTEKTLSLLLERQAKRMVGVAPTAAKWACSHSMLTGNPLAA
ncbi:MAG: hypothetical protein HY268_07740 [Deltaproteobacteria bacterium]|nr:hypothetical protein [Deltaproteobacteria bacterium]